MLITRKYKFYAAHRNELLNDKCRNLHGHTYRVECDFRFCEKLDSGVGMLFSDLDDAVAPYIARFDHCLLLHKKDPLYAMLHTLTPEDTLLKIEAFDFPTTAGNLGQMIFSVIENQLELPIVAVRFQETDSGWVTITKGDL